MLRGLLRMVGALAVVAVLPLSAIGVHGHANVYAQGVATVSPVSGSVNDLFTFSVSGLTPGNTVRIQIVDGGGTTFQLSDSSGNPLVLIVQADGTVTDQLTPAVDTPTAVPGTWTATFEEIETGANASIDFTVSS